MIAPGIVFLGAAALVSAGMATTIAGILAPALFLPGAVVIGAGLAAAAAGGVLALFDRDGMHESTPPTRDAAAN